MITFEVSDMTCGHCVGSITKAVMNVDDSAKFTIDRASHRITIDSTGVDPIQFQDAISGAGFTPLRLDGTAAE